MDWYTYARSADHTPTGHHRAAKEEAGSSASGRRRSSAKEANLEPSLRNQPESALQRQWEGNRKQWGSQRRGGKTVEDGKGTERWREPQEEYRPHRAAGTRSASLGVRGSRPEGAASLHGSGRGTRDAGPGARPLEVAGGGQVGWGEGGLGLGDNKRLAEPTHRVSTLLSRAPQPTFLHYPPFKEIATDLVRRTTFLRHVGAQREPGDRPRTRPSSSLNP